MQNLPRLRPALTRPLDEADTTEPSGEWEETTERGTDLALTTSGGPGFRSQEELTACQDKHQFSSGKGINCLCTLHWWQKIIRCSSPNWIFLKGNDQVKEWSYCAWKKKNTKIIWPAKRINFSVYWSKTLTSMTVSPSAIETLCKGFASARKPSVVEVSIWGESSCLGLNS